MLEIMNWIAQDVRHVVGTAIFIVLITCCLVAIITAARAETFDE